MNIFGFSRNNFKIIIISSLFLGVASVILMNEINFCLNILLTVKIFLSLINLFFCSYWLRPFIINPMILFIFSVLSLSINIGSTYLMIFHLPIKDRLHPGHVIHESFLKERAFDGVVFFIISVAVYLSILLNSPLKNKQELPTNITPSRSKKTLMRNGKLLMQHFIHSDALMGLSFVVLNFLSVLSIGMVQYHLPLEDSLSIYALMSIGDGLSYQYFIIASSFIVSFFVIFLSQKESFSFYKTTKNFLSKTNLLAFSIKKNHSESTSKRIDTLENDNNHEYLNTQ